MRNLNQNDSGDGNNNKKLKTINMENYTFNSHLDLSYPYAKLPASF